MLNVSLTPKQYVITINYNYFLLSFIIIVTEYAIQYYNITCTKRNAVYKYVSLSYIQIFK